jgi:hypothetical protein
MEDHDVREQHRMDGNPVLKFCECCGLSFIDDGNTCQSCTEKYMTDMEKYN